MDVDSIRSQFADGYYGVITKNGFRIGVRYIQMLYMLVTSIVMGFIRGSIGVAVLAINDQTRRGDSYIKIYNWDGKVQGAVLSSFFVGYALMLIPSEKILKNINGKLLTTVTLSINGLLCVAMPTIVNKGGWMAVCGAKFCMGLTHACFYVINHMHLEIWLPPNEKKFFSSVIFSGVQIGIIIALPLAGRISTAALGWELVYYSLAMVGLSMAVISGTLTASTPEDHQAVGDNEKEFIRENLKRYRKKELQIPWHDILLSSNLWGVVCAHAASNTLFIFYLTYMPVYILTFGMTLENSSWYCMLPFITMAVIYIIVRPISEWIYKVKYVNYFCSVNIYRKTINTIGVLGIVMGLTTLLNVPRELNSTIVVLTAILGLLGLQFCGFLTSITDMSENFAGTVMMLSCSFSSIFSAIMVFIFGYILGDDQNDLSRWRIIFLTLASLYFVGNVLYIVLGRNERQYWDQINSKKQTGHLNILMHMNKEQFDENEHTTYVSYKNEMDTAL